MGMNYRSGVSKRLYTHLRLLGVKPQEISQLLNQIHIWVNNSGPEWTVSRLKDLKTGLIQGLAGEKSAFPWIKYSKGAPKGVFRRVFLEALSNRLNSKKVAKALSILMVYTGYLSKEVTDKQYKKTVGSIESEDVLPDSKKDYLRRLGNKIGAKHIGLVNLKWTFSPAGLNSGKPDTLSTLGGLLPSWGHDKYIESFISGLSVPFVGQYLERKGNLPSCLSLPIPWDDELAASPGQISVIQERGYKARVIAMPHAAIQVALYPLHQLLNQLLKQLKTDCTHNQEDGAEFAQQALKEGHTVYSVDLSGATDNFPLSVQIGVLEGIGLTSEASLIQNLSSSKWRLSPQLAKVCGKEYVTYTKGQPQGMYGSFPLFGLTHNLVLAEICDKLGYEPMDSYRILGDDIVITKEPVYRKYMEFLDYSKVPVSHDKSISSDKVAEFAGFFITKNYRIKPAKVPNGDWSNGFMNYLSVTGYRGVEQLPSKVRRIARLAMQLPEDLGGLGFNPKGISLEERVKSLVKSTEHEIPKYVGLKSSLIAGKFSYLRESEVMVDWLIEQINRFEQFTQSVLHQHKQLGDISSEPHALAYQLSVLSDVLLTKHEGRVLVGNRADDTRVLSGEAHFESEFSKWDRLLTKSETLFDKYNRPAEQKMQRDWSRHLA
jgi:hypothetical protein